MTPSGLLGGLVACSGAAPTPVPPASSSPSPVPATSSPLTTSTPWRTLATRRFPGSDIGFGQHDPAGGRVIAVGYSRAEQVLSAGLSIHKHLMFAADAPGEYGIKVVFTPRATNNVTSVECRNHPNNVFRSGTATAFSERPGEVLITLTKWGAAAKGSTQEPLLVVCKLALKGGPRGEFNATQFVAVTR